MARNGSFSSGARASSGSKNTPRVHTRTRPRHFSAKLRGWWVGREGGQCRWVKQWGLELRSRHGNERTYENGSSSVAPPMAGTKAKRTAAYSSSRYSPSSSRRRLKRARTRPAILVLGLD